MQPKIPKVPNNNTSHLTFNVCIIIFYFSK